MGDALPFVDIKLTSPLLFLRALAVSNVLDRSEPLAGLTRHVSGHRAVTVDDTHLPAGTNDAEFYVWKPSAPSLLRCPKQRFSILGVDHFLECRNVHRTFLWPQSE